MLSLAPVQVVYVSFSLSPRRAAFFAPMKNNYFPLLVGEQTRRAASEMRNGRVELDATLTEKRLADVG